MQAFDHAQAQAALAVEHFGYLHLTQQTMILGLGAGEGIFFSSKLMDAFDVRSGKLHFMHDEWGANVLLERPAAAPGTLVLMRLANERGYLAGGVRSVRRAGGVHLCQDHRAGATGAA